MVKKAETPSEEFLKAVADSIGAPIQTVRQLHELQNQQDVENLIATRNTIVSIFNGFGENGHSNADAELPAITQHQLGVRLIQALGKAKSNILLRILRMKQLTELATIPLLDEGVKKIIDWVTHFEERNRQILREAIDMGINIRSLEDAAMPF